MAQAPRANAALWRQDGTARRRANWRQSAAGAQHLQGSAEPRHWRAQGMAPYPATQAGAGACEGVQGCAPPAANRPGSAHSRGSAAEPAGKPGAGDLRGPRFRCSRCGRDLSAAGFAQRVLHVKKCAAAGERPGLRCPPALRPQAAWPVYDNTFVTGCTRRGPSVLGSPSRTRPASAASCRATSSSAAAGAPHTASLLLHPTRARGGAAAAAQAASEAPLPAAFRPFVAQAPAACAGAARAPAPAPPPASVRAWLGGLQLERHAPAFEAVRGAGPPACDRSCAGLVAACALGPAAQHRACCVTLRSVAPCTARACRRARPLTQLSRANACCVSAVTLSALSQSAVASSVCLPRCGAAHGRLGRACPPRAHGLRPDALCRAGRERGCERRQTPCCNRVGLPPGAATRGGSAPTPLARRAGASRPGVPAPAQRRGPGVPGARMPRRAPPRARGHRRAARAAAREPPARPQRLRQRGGAPRRPVGGLRPRPRCGQCPQRAQRLIRLPVALDSRCATVMSRR